MTRRGKPVLPIALTDDQEDIEKHLSPRTSWQFSVFAVLSLAAWTLFALTVRSTLPQRVALTRDTRHLFSAVESLKHLSNITQSFHPWASQANRKVGKYLMDTLISRADEARARGLNVELHTQDSSFVAENDLSLVKFDEPIIIVEPFRRTHLDVPTVLVIEPRNILFRFNARAGHHGKALLVTGHFDSAVTSHGAFDDGLAVTTMLECIRALIETDRVATALKHDIIFMFGDGEEVGLYDASVFIHHPWFTDVVAFINVEAGGNGNREMLFRASDINLSRLYVQSVPHPHVSSMMTDLF